MKIGIISDTHNYLDPKVVELFAGVDHILHAGDVGLMTIIHQLENIAPVTAVLGNTDSGIPLREMERVELGGTKFLIRHIVDPHEREGNPWAAGADVVIFGHTHKPAQVKVGGTLFLNPGYAGKQRFELPRSLATMTLAGEPRIEVHWL